jgi:hypothetical protein
LKRIVADSVARQVLQDTLRRKNPRPARKRKLVDEMRANWEVSQRRGCGVLCFAPESHRYRSPRRGQAILEARIKEIRATRIRYGYRRVHVPAAARELGRLPQAHVSSPKRVGPAIAQQGAAASREGGFACC